MLKIYHNPRCSKSRQTLQLIQKNNADVNIIEYLKEVPSAKELKNVLNQLGLNPQDILRKGETIFKDQYKGKAFSDEEWIDIMIANPKLIERPIVFNDKAAIIGRPPENVLELL